LGNKLKHTFAFFAGAMCFAVYMLTLHPSVGFVDCGELAAASYTFGVPHPTGYPLFLITGYIVSHLPFEGSVIYRLNVMSALESAAAVVITFYSAVIVLRNLVPVILKSKAKPKQKQKNQPADEGSESVAGIQIYLVAVISAVSVGMIKTFWFEATQTEVYALHSLFISVLIYYCIKIIFSIKTADKKDWALLLLFLGLSLASHSTTIYFIPGILYLLYLQKKENGVAFRSVLPYLFFVIPGLILYSVLFIAAAPQPYLNFSNIHDMGSFIEHVRGSEFSQLMFSSSASFSGNLAAFFKTLPGELAILPGIAGLAGLIALWKTKKPLFIFSALLMVTCLLYSFNYKSVEIMSFYLLAYYLLVFYASLGVVYLLVSFGSTKTITGRSLKPAVIAASVLICIFSVGYNYSENNNSGNYVNEDITKNIFYTLEPNSILLVYEYPFVYSSSLYYQQVEKLRPDIKVLLVTYFAAPWYLEMIKKYYPDLYDGIKTEAEDYVKSYDNDDKQKGAKLITLVRTFIEKNFGKFPVYLTVDFLVSKDAKMFYGNLVPSPDGLVYRLKTQNLPYDEDAGVKSLDVNFRNYKPEGYHKNRANILTAGVLYETAYYHYKNNNPETALKFIEKTLSINNGFKDALNLKNKILSERK
jgi:hypothetical protein